MQGILYKGIDFGKFCGAVLVIATHTKPFYDISIINYLSLCVFQVAVPFFFIVSSFLFWSKSHNLPHFVSRILIMYTLWFLLELPIFLHHYYNGEEIFFSKLIIDLFFNNTFYASWFLSALIESIILIYILNYFPKYISISICIICYTMAVFDSMYYGLLPHKMKVLFDSLFFSIHPSHSFIVALPLCFIGKIIAERKSIYKNTNNIFTILFLCFIFLLEIVLVHDYRRSVTCFFSLIPISISLVVTSLNMKINFLSPNMSVKLRSLSIILFLSHLVVKEVFNLSFGAPIFVIVLLISLCLGGLIIRLSNKVCLLRYLF